MGGERKGPQARDLILGARLRAVRKEQTSLSLERAAELAQWSPSTLSRIETGKRHVSPEDVATLCTIYGLPVTEREELVDSAKSAGNSSGWWDKPLPGVPREMGALASYEADAIRLTDWSVTLVPGLLQTYRYAVGLMVSDGVESGDIERRWMARLRRQQILGTVDYTAYICQTALRIPFGGGQALKEQVQRLADAHTRGVQVRVVPEHSPYGVMLHSWLLMEFSHTSPAVNVEVMNGGVYLHDEDALAYVSVLATIERVALSAPESRHMLHQTAEEL